MLRGRQRRECVWWTSENLFTLSLVWLKEETQRLRKILYSLLWCNAIFWTVLLELISFEFWCTARQTLKFSHEGRWSAWVGSVCVCIPAVVQVLYFSCLIVSHSILFTHFLVPLCCVLVIAASPCPPVGVVLSVLLSVWVFLSITTSDWLCPVYH